MSLLPEGFAILLELPLRLPDLRCVFPGESLGNQQRADLGLSRLRAGPHDVIEASGGGRPKNRSTGTTGCLDRFCPVAAKWEAELIPPEDRGRLVEKGRTYSTELLLVKKMMP